MGRALELVVGFVTAPSTTFTAWTLAAGNSLGVRNAPAGSRIFLLQAWADNQAAGALRVRSPKMHDNVQGLRLDITASDAKPLIPPKYRQMLYPQDQLIVEHTGSAVAGDIETGALLVWYEDLPGADARLVSPQDIDERIVNLVAVENTLALGTAGGYSGEEAINAEFDLLKANTDYALLGYLVDGECAAVGWRGADTANLRVGGPGDELARQDTREWFVRLSQWAGLPCIPVFNSANRAGILIDGAQDENGTDVTVTSLFAELSPGPLPVAGLRR